MERLTLFREPPPAVSVCSTGRGGFMRFRYGIAAIAAVLAAISAAAIGPARAASPGALCGTLAGSTPHVTKVLWIFMENQSYGTGANQIPGNPSAPYIHNTLIGHCGSTSDYHSASHPSYPNYLAATSGSTQGVSSDHLGYFGVPSIFSQVDPSWRSYQAFNNAVIGHCGTPSHYHSASPPSYPNYLAATSGSTQGVSSDHLGYLG